MPGAKARAEEVEEAHPLMFVFGLKQAVADMPAGYILDKATLARMIDTHNEGRTGSAVIGREKRAAIESLTAMPSAVFAVWQQEYHAHTWEKMILNAKLCAHAAWDVAHQDEIAKGPWRPVYANTEKVILTTQAIALRRWRQVVPMASLAGRSASEIARLRPSHEELLVLSLRVRLWVQWAAPMLEQHYGADGADEGRARVDSAIVSGELDDELDNMAAARSKPALYGDLDAQSLPGLCKIYRGDAVGTGVLEELEKRFAGTIADFKKFKEAWGRDVTKFLNAVAAQKARASSTILERLGRERRQADTGKAVIEQKFLPSHLYIVPATEIKKPTHHIDSLEIAIKRDVGMSINTTARFPHLHVWDQNSGGPQIETKSVWSPVVDGIKASMLANKPGSMAVTVSKRTGRHREKFLYQVYDTLDTAGFDGTATFSIHFDADGQASNSSHSNNGPGRIFFVETARLGSGHLFSRSAILRGVLSLVKPSTAGDRRQATVGTHDPENEPLKADGTGGYNNKAMQTSEDTWLRVVDRACTAEGENGRAPATPLEGRVHGSVQNQSGQPVILLVVWDPSPISFVKAFLTMKQKQMQWRQGDEVMAVDYRAIVFPLDKEKEQALKTYASVAGTRAWIKGDLHVKDPRSETRVNEPAASGPVVEAPPEFEVATVGQNGVFGPKGALLNPYLDCEATAAAACQFLQEVTAQFQDGGDCPRLQVAAKPSENWVSAEVKALEVDTESMPTRELSPPSSIAELEKLGPWEVDTVASNGKIRVLVNAAGRGFGVVTGTCQVVAGGQFLAPGSGGARPVAEYEKTVAEKWCAVVGEFTSDNQEVLYKSSANPSNLLKFTLYGLKAQLALDGYPGAELNLHTLKETTGGDAGLQRYAVNCLQKIYWVHTSRKRPANVEDKNVGSTRAMAWLHDHSNIPNQFVRIVWIVDLVVEPTPTIRLVQPILVWSKTFSFTDGQIFQFA